MKHLLLLAICAFGINSYAGQGIYIKGGIGHLLSGDTDLEYSDGDQDKLEHETTFAHPLLFGFGMYLSETLSLEFDLAYRSSDFEDIIPGTAEFSSLLAGANIIAHLGSGTVVKPYFGGGISLGRYDLGVSVLDAEFGAGLNFLFGIDFVLGAKASIGPELRHHMTIIHPEFDLSLIHI